MKPSAVYFFVPALILFSCYSCKREYSYEGGPLSSGYLVKDSGNNCGFISVTGNYVVGKTLTDSDFLQVQVHVTRPGRYNITSDHINGYSFASSGSFNDTGLLLVKLPASSKPISAGTNLFNLQYDSSICQVQVTVHDSLVNLVNVVQTSNPDHFPLAKNNRWIYDDLSYPGDSIIRTISGNTTINGVLYNVIAEYISFFPATNEIYYRKAGSDYLEYTAVSTYTDALDYAPTLYDDLIFSKEDCHTGDTWYSNTYSGRTSLGLQVLVLRYLFLCTDADATVVISGKTFLHVIKMEMIPEVANQGENPKATGEIHTAYYAKGVGLIYRETFNGIRTHPELQIRSWVVN
jgi:hypothetical protein